MPAYASRTKEEIDVLWSSDLPVSRDLNPALWDALLGFFEDAIVASCSRPGSLVITPRELLKQLKHNGTEPSAGVRVIEELYNRGDIVSADSLKAPSNSTQSSYSLSSLKTTVGSYLWGSAKPKAPALDDPIVPVAALKAVAQKASTLSGPTASGDIHTVKTFADDLTAGNTRDAEAVIAHIVSKGEAIALFTDPTTEDPDPILGVKLGRGSANPADKGVLRTKAALEKMEKVSSHLDHAVEAEREAAVAAAKAGNKSDALSRLKKKKALEAKLNGARATATKLSDVLMAVDEAESNREAVSALETGMSSLKTATEGGVTADRVDAVAADFDEMLAEQQDVRHALEQLNQGPIGADEALLEQELEELVAGEQEPSAIPTEKPPMTEEEKELLKIMQGLGISGEEAALMQAPEKVAETDAAKKAEGSTKASDEHATVSQGA